MLCCDLKGETRVFGFTKHVRRNSESVTGVTDAVKLTRFIASNPEFLLLLKPKIRPDGPFHSAPMGNSVSLIDLFAPSIVY